jgi:hypothetical protein
MRKIRIVSDGTRNGTKITDADTGETIPKVTGFSIDHSARDPVMFAKLTTYAIEVDVTAQATIEAVKDSPIVKALAVNVSAGDKIAVIVKNLHVHPEARRRFEEQLRDFFGVPAVVICADAEIAILKGTPCTQEQSPSPSVSALSA